jgi:hypothetical protein
METFQLISIIIMDVPSNATEYSIQGIMGEKVRSGHLVMTKTS